MTIFIQAFSYAVTHLPELLVALEQHLFLVGAALGLAFLIGLPLGIWTSRSRMAAALAINLFNSLRVAPSLAVLFLSIPVFGLSFTSTALALIVLALPPILINTDTAFRSIQPAVLEAAAGMGMTRGQALLRVELPLALPVILAGVRTSAVEVIASATLAAFIGSGGLGIFITRGFALYDNAILLVGAVPVAMLSLLAETGFSRLERLLQPPGS